MKKGALVPAPILTLTERLATRKRHAWTHSQVQRDTGEHAPLLESVVHFL